MTRSVRSVEKFLLSLLSWVTQVLRGNLSGCCRLADSELEVHGRDTVAHLLIDAGETYHFAHSHLRSVIAYGLTARRRRGLQGDIAPRMLSHYGSEDGGRLLTIVEHLQWAEPGRQAVDRWSCAQGGGAASSLRLGTLRRGATRTAPAGFQRALPHATSHFWSLRAGQAHHRNHDFSSAVPHHLRAVELARQAATCDCGARPCIGCRAPTCW